MKNQKGITLIALIITIIVMLILVGVSVTVAINTGLFKTASGVSKNTEVHRDEELERANGTVNLGGKNFDINEYVDGLIAKLPAGVEIGDYVEYDCGVASYTAGWRVLGLNDKGQILLISEDIVLPNSGGTTMESSNEIITDPTERNYYCFGDETGFDSVLTELEEICAVYKNETEGAVEARSIKLEDIRKNITAGDLSDLAPNSGEYKMLLTNGSVDDFTYQGEWDDELGDFKQETTGKIMYYFLADTWGQVLPLADFDPESLQYIGVESYGVWYCNGEKLKKSAFGANDGSCNFVVGGARPVIVLKSDITLTKVEGETKDGCNVFTIE